MIYRVSQLHGTVTEEKVRAENGVRSIGNQKLKDPSTIRFASPPRVDPEGVVRTLVVRLVTGGVHDH
jgi:hypothetical protein